MKAAVCTKLDGPDAIELVDLPEPTAGPGEVVVRTRAAALNFLDTLITRGKYQFKPELPFSPSAEIAGEVVALGEGVEDIAIGQRVAGYIGWGGAREYVAVRRDLLVEVPDGIPDAVAAGVSVTFGTAMYGLFDRGRLRPGETVAVLGAAGGAGLAAVEVAALAGAEVIAVASSADKLEICRQHGAQRLLNYREHDLRQGLRDMTGGRGPDVIYDCVGGADAEAALRSIAWLGRFLVIGFASGAIPKIPLNLALLKNCDIAGVFWGEAAVRDPAAQRRNIAQVFDWIAAGRMMPHTSEVFPLDQIAAAIRRLDARAATGKLIIEID
jgi:NADPH2:quinone reductase